MRCGTDSLLNAPECAKRFLLLLYTKRKQIFGDASSLNKIKKEKTTKSERERRELSVCFVLLFTRHKVRQPSKAKLYKSD